MRRTGENASIKGGGGEPKGGGGGDATQTKSEEIDLSNPIHVRFGLHAKFTFAWASMKIRIRPLPSAQWQAFPNPLSTNHIVQALYT